MCLALSDDERREAFAQSRVAIEQERWQDALDICTRLWAEQRSFDVALQLGLIQMNLGRHAEAANHLSFGIRHLPAREPRETADRARAMLELASARVGEVGLEVDPPGAELMLDGVSFGSAPLAEPFFVEPGTHVVEAKLAGFEPARQAFEARAGERSSLRLSLSPSSAQRTPQSNQGNGHAEMPRESAGLQAREIVLITGGVLTAGLLTAGIVEKVIAGNASDDAEAARKAAIEELGQSCTPESSAPVCAELFNALDRREAAHQLGNYFLAGSAVAAVATTVTFLLLPKRRSASVNAAFDLSVSPERASASFTMAF